MSTCSFVLKDKQRTCRNPVKSGGRRRCWIHSKNVMFASKISHIQIYDPEPNQHRHPSAESWRRFVEENMFRCAWSFKKNWFDLRRSLWGMWRDAHAETRLEMTTTLLWGRMRKIGIREFSSRLVLVAHELIYLIRSSKVSFDHIALMVPDRCSAWIGILCADIITPYLTQICWQSDTVKRRPGEHTLVIHLLDHLSNESVTGVEDTLQNVPIIPGHPTKHVLLCPYANRETYQRIRAHILVLPSCFLTETWGEAAAYVFQKGNIDEFYCVENTDMIYFEHRPFRGSLGRILQYGCILSSDQNEVVPNSIGCLVDHVENNSSPWDPRLGPYYSQIRFTYMGSAVSFI